jgi:hypothetical protein
VGVYGDGAMELRGSRPTECAAHNLAEDMDN